MLTRLGSLFQKNKNSASSVDDVQSRSDVNIRALTETLEPKKKTTLRHSWTSGQSVAISTGSTASDLGLSEELTSELDTKIPEGELEEKPAPVITRGQTFAGKFINWLQSDKKHETKISESEELPSTTVNMSLSSIDQVIIDNYTPGPNAGKKSLLELMELAGHLEETYKIEHSLDHIQAEFRLYNENLVKSFRCSVWIDDRVFLGEIHLTEENLCFDSKPNAMCKFVIPLRSINDLEVIEDEKSSGNPWFSWKTLTNPPEDEQTQCFETLGSLVASQKDTNTSNELKTNAQSPLLVRPTSKIQQTGQDSRKTFEEEFLKSTFPFALPVQILIDDSCDMVKGLHHMAEGTLYMSQGCVCFHSKEKLSDWICVTIPLIDINQIKKADKGKAIQIISTCNELLFFPGDCKSSFALIDRAWKDERLRRCRDLTGLWGLERSVRQEQELLTRQIFIRREIKLNKKQTEVWNHYFDTHGNGCEVIVDSQISVMIRDGIPNEFRGFVWQLSCGSLQRLKMYGENEVARLLQHVYNEESSVPRKEIEKDLHRSLPQHPHFEAGGAGIQELRRVLCAYALRNPDIGYCQSMNIVCAVFLLFMSEEEVFWLLTVIAENLLPEYYSSPLVGLMTDQYILELFVEEKLPGLVEHLQYLGINLSIITMPWFLCLFINFLPWSATLRVLDSFFLNGPVILFQITLGILALEKNNIMKQDDGIELFNLTKRVSAKPEKIFEIAEKEFGFINMELISQMRTQYREKIVEELGVYSRILDEISDDDEPENFADESSESLFVPYVPRQGEREEKTQNTLGNHRTSSNHSSDSDSEARRSVAAKIQKKWNHSVNSLLPRARSGHRRLHSDGRVFLRPKVASRFRTTSAQLNIDPSAEVTSSLGDNS